MTMSCWVCAEENDNSNGPLLAVCTPRCSCPCVATHSKNLAKAGMLSGHVQDLNCAS